MGWADGKAWRFLAPGLSNPVLRSATTTRLFVRADNASPHAGSCTIDRLSRSPRASVSRAPRTAHDRGSRWGRADALEAVIEDELPGAGRRSRFEVRAQMFDGSGVPATWLQHVVALGATNEGIRVFRALFESGCLLEMTVAVGVIEAWYVDVARRLEALYLNLGYSAGQVATYTLHARADVGHSTVALEFVDEYAAAADHADLVQAVRRGFQSVRLFDQLRLEAATTRGSLQDLFGGVVG